MGNCIVKENRQQEEISTVISQGLFLATNLDQHFNYPHQLKKKKEEICWCLKLTGILQTKDQNVLNVFKTLRPGVKAKLALKQLHTQKFIQNQGVCKERIPNPSGQDRGGKGAEFIFLQLLGKGLRALCTPHCSSHFKVEKIIIIIIDYLSIINFR